LTKEEEDAVGDEVEVRREDQDKINKFSRLHQHELTIQEELKAKNVSSCQQMQVQIGGLREGSNFLRLSRKRRKSSMT
jgi:hypothetical protein